MVLLFIEIVQTIYTISGAFSFLYKRTIDFLSFCCVFHAHCTCHYFFESDNKTPVNELIYLGKKDASWNIYICFEWVWYLYMFADGFEVWKEIQIHLTAVLQMTSCKTRTIINSMLRVILQGSNHVRQRYPIFWVEHHLMIKWFLCHMPCCPKAHLSYKCLVKTYFSAAVPIIKTFNKCW